MDSDEDTMTISVRADIEPFRAAMQDLNQISQSFGNTITSSLSKAIIHGKNFEGTLRTIALRISSMALSRGLAPLEKLIGNALGKATGAFIPAMPFAKGGVFDSGNRFRNFPSGGIVQSPTFFTTAGRLGVMGEKGPEAVMPLARGSDGSLGIKGPAAGSPNIIFNVTTHDASSFQRSETQISTMLARAVARGRRGL